MSFYVLLPGAGGEAWYWHLVEPRLRALGHDVVAVDLPAADENAGLREYADAAAAAIGGRDDAIVVAQSMAAFIAVPHARRFILVAPMIPAPGETAGEWWANTRHADTIADLLQRHGPMGEWGQAALDEVFLHDVDPETVRATAGYSRAPGPGMFSEPWPLERWPDVPTRVLAPRDDRLFPLEFQTRVARERLRLEVDVIDGGHLPMLSRPAELARYLHGDLLLPSRQRVAPCRP
jgi:pimeloyl-ACP methyl ester carboxylesterase